MPATETFPFHRNRLIQKLEQQSHWDLLVIGGGATGLGIAVDAATRGYSTVLLERADFAQGTSSRSTKLVHGGVRYLAQGNIPLVYSALQERGRLLQNAPHTVSKCPFIIPCYTWFDVLKYGVGLKLYDALAGKWRFGKSKALSKRDVLQQLPGLDEKNLKGGVLYFDGQFDDARLAINLAQTAIAAGAVVLNHVEVTALQKTDGKLTSVVAHDKISGTEFHLSAAAIINATGIFADGIRQLDQPHGKPLLQWSRGVHLVFDQATLPATSALMIPKTSDGRVLFAIPWQGYTVVGTTDTPVEGADAEPRPSEEEIRFILDTLNRHLKKGVTQKNVRSVFAGLRPLVLPQSDFKSTKELSRDHKVTIGNSGLITITGGKWTTYRKMAEDALNVAIKNGLLSPKNCITKNLAIYGAPHYANQNETAGMGNLKSLEGADRIHPKFSATEADVRRAVRHELAMTVEDVLARRLRLLFLDAYAAIEAAPRVAEILRDELGKTEAWQQEQILQFTQLATQYTISENTPAAVHQTITTN